MTQVTPEEWQQIKKVLTGALERTPEKRPAYLDRVCAEPSLRREVESLIVAHEQGDRNFLECAAVEGGVLKSGTKLGPYEILVPLGAGGMGEVYRARDTRLERDVAVKVLSPGLLADEAARRRFRNEALALAKLNHANIGGVYEFGRQGDLDFLVMEYVPGATLADRLTQGALPEKEVAALGTQIAAALEEAHEHGVVHRDLKPGNIVVTPKGQVKVLDFGLARLLRPVSQAAAKAEALTETQGLSGTLPYMAPEQLRGEPADARTDIHAAGAVLYEMATGQRPFSQAHGPQLMAAILNEMPRPPRSLNPRVSPGLETVILKALDKEPENRYQSAKELAVDLRRLAAPTLPVVKPAARARKVRRAALVMALAAAFLLAITVGLNLSGWRQRLLGKAAGPRIQSVAVLPFNNLTGDPAQEYFVEGMTDALTTELAQIKALRVISRTSAMQYKGAKKGLPQIARELNVDAVVEGTVRRDGDRIWITPQLIEAATDRHLWAKPYGRNLREAPALQNQMAQDIVREMRIELTAGEQTRLAGPRPPVNQEAYEAYLQGRYFVNKRSTEAVKKSVPYFQQAIRFDPNYALAYAGLADAYNLLGRGTSLTAAMPPQEAAAKARASALKALELDPGIGEAHTALGWTKSRYDWDWAGAEKEFQRGIELSPGYAYGYQWYGVFLYGLGRNAEALAMSQHAQQLDPVSPNILNQVGFHLAILGRYDEAIAQFHRLIELDPSHDIHLPLGFIYMKMKKFPEAIAEHEKAVELSGRKTIPLTHLAYDYAVSGRRAEAEKLLAELKGRNEPQDAYYGSYAGICAALGRKDEAFMWLEKEFEVHAFGLLSLRALPEYEPLHSDPRFNNLLRRMNLPEIAPRK